jgi:hypothetical protein
MTINSRLVSAFGSMALAISVWGISGCSEELGPESMPVTRVIGSVTEGGRPLSKGWVEFFPVDGTVGNLRSAPLRSDGSFDADGVAVGQNMIRLVNAGIRKELGIFSTFQSPIRRRVPVKPGDPLRIELVDEAIRYQNSFSRQASSGSGSGSASASAGESR